MAWVSAPTYPIMAKVLACLALGGCIGGIAIGSSYAFGGGNKVGEKSSLTKEEKKEQVLKEIEGKKCYVTAGGSQEESKFGAIYMCPTGESASSDDFDEVSSGSKALYYLEEESAFDKLEPSKSPMSLFKKVTGLKYQKEGELGPHLLLNLGEGVEKKIPVGSSDNWQLFGGFYTQTVGGETVTEIVTGDSSH